MAAQATTRSIIVKLSSYRHKAALMKGRKSLKDVDAAGLFPHPNWPALPAHTDRSRPAPVHRIFINDDLTKSRSLLAARARKLKKDKRVDDTWVRDGTIFVKCGESKKAFTTLRDLDLYFGNLSQ
jgi:hypothetical protein